MVHRLSDLLGNQSTKDKPTKQTDKHTDKQQVYNKRPEDLAILQDLNLADSGFNTTQTDGGLNTVTPISPRSFSFESGCESPYGTYSYISTPFSTESLVRENDFDKIKLKYYS